MFSTNKKYKYSIRQLLHCVWFFSILLSSCNITRSVPDGSYLLIKAKVKVDKGSLTSELKPIIKQKPNRSLLGVYPFYLAVYTLADRGKETKLKRYLKKTVGEPPVIFDKLITTKSTTQIKLYLNNNGYFNAQVIDTVVFKRKRAYVTYKAIAGKPYIVSNILYNIADENIRNLVLADTILREIKLNENYNTSLMSKERERISKMLRDHGYFSFNQDYIKIKADSSFNNFTTVLKINIENPEFRKEDTLKENFTHQKYFINNVYINEITNLLELDTISKMDTSYFKDYIFIGSQTKRKVRPSILVEHLFINKDSIYSLQNTTFTYQRLQDLGIYKYINIEYKESEKDSLNRLRLDCFISLNQAKFQAYGIENEITNNGGALGLAGNINYSNKNIFRGAELFEFKIKGAIEALTNFIDSTSNDKFLFFNSYSIGPEISLKLPRFLISPKFLNESKRSNPSTLLNSNLLYEKTPDYRRNTTNLSFGLSWKSKKYFRHFVYPFEVNYVRVHLSPAFEENLQKQENLALSSSFSNHLIADGRYTVLFSTQEKIKHPNFIYSRASIEFAGNILNLLKKPLNYTKDSETGQYQVLNVPYSQYVKAEIDFRYYQIINKHNNFVYRGFLGYGIAYGNSNVNGTYFLPFEKSFYTGGSNDLRAYKMRTVGPGSYVTNNNYEKFGDIKINLNFEHRFDIFKKFQGAAFLDAGNVWFRQNNSSFPNGEFKFDRFYKEIASGVGLGLRLNLTFLIFRLDGAVKLSDPSKTEGNRFVIDNAKFKDTQYNFGIGYPF